MNKNLRTGAKTPNRKGRPIKIKSGVKPESLDDLTLRQEVTQKTIDLQPAAKKTEVIAELPLPAQETYDTEDREQFKTEVERFIEISKYFSSPLRKTATYLSDQTLVSYPSAFRVEYKRGGVTTEHIKFCNLVLEPIYVKLFKMIPDLEQIKFINLSLSRCKRIPPGLSFNLGFVYDDVNEKESVNAKMIFVASRKTTTPCYQICEIELVIDAQKNKRYITA